MHSCRRRGETVSDGLDLDRRRANVGTRGSQFAPHQRSQNSVQVSCVRSHRAVGECRRRGQSVERAQVDPLYQGGRGELNGGGIRPVNIL